MMDNTVFYENLANAIVAQAAKDYLRALKQLKKYPNYEDALARKREIERFFRSEWYSHLTKVNADYLISKLEMAVSA
jgi:hypothetical protein